MGCGEPGLVLLDVTFSSEANTKRPADFYARKMRDMAADRGVGRASTRAALPALIPTQEFFVPPRCANVKLQICAGSRPNRGRGLGHQSRGNSLIQSFCLIDNLFVSSKLTTCCCALFILHHPLSRPPFHLWSHRRGVLCGNMARQPFENPIKKKILEANDPIRAIEEFQLEKGIMLPSLRPMLPLLDLHGVRRLEFHQSVLEELKGRLTAQIDKLGKSDKKEDHKMLQKLLDDSFRFIKVPTLQPIVMAVLKNVNTLDENVLKMLTLDRNIYKACDVSVKRQIWLDFQSMFGDECSPLIQDYIQEKEKLLTDALDVNLPFYSITPKQRRQNKIIQEFAQMVGDNFRLYETMVQFLRMLFLKTKNIHYCSLRVEFLMALHDKDVQGVTTMDPVHKFVWCLDACIREQAIDPRRSRELLSFLESIRVGQEKILADISMVLCDPYAIHFLASSAFKTLNHLISNGALPRGNTVLILILRLLNLGLHSWDIINSSVYREPRLDVKLFTKFIPMMMTLIVDDAIRNLSAAKAEAVAAAAVASSSTTSLSTAESSSSATGTSADAASSTKDEAKRESAIAMIEQSALPELFQRFIDKDRLAAVLAKHLSHFRVKFASSSRQLVSRPQM